MTRDAENFSRTDPGLLSQKLELWQYAHDLQGRYNIPLSPVDMKLNGPDIMAALYESFQLKTPEIPKTKTDAIAFLQGRLEAQLESGQGGAAEGADIYGGSTPDYIDSSSGPGHNRRRMRSDSSGADEARARYAARIEANGGQRGRRASVATGGEELRTDSVELNWQQGPDGQRWVNLNDLHPGVISAPATPTSPAPRTDEANPAAAGDSRAPASYTARIESGGKGKRKPKFHHS